MILVDLKKLTDSK